MKKTSSGVCVTKTLVRNCEQKVPQTFKILHETHSQKLQTRNCLPEEVALKENDLSRPSLCSSESLANYLEEVKNSLPPPLSKEDLSNEKEAISTKITKKLNFPLNDKMYKNLVELNAELPMSMKLKKEKKPTTRPVKRDLEPNIEDFFENQKEIDIPPQIPIIKPKFKQVRHVDKGQLHKLLAQFE